MSYDQQAPTPEKARLQERLDDSQTNCRALRAARGEKEGQ